MSHHPGGSHRVRYGPPTGRSRALFLVVVLVAVCVGAAWLVTRSPDGPRPASVTSTASSAPAVFTPAAGDPVVYQGRLYFFVSFHDAGRGPREHAVLTATRGGKQVLVPGDGIAAP